MSARVFAIDAADRHQPIEVALGQQIQILHQLFHRRIEAAALFQLQRQASGISRAITPVGSKPCMTPARATRRIACADAVCDLQHVGAHIAPIIDRIDQHAADHALNRERPASVSCVRCSGQRFVAGERFLDARQIVEALAWTRLSTSR